MWRTSIATALRLTSVSLFCPNRKDDAFSHVDVVFPCVHSGVVCAYAPVVPELNRIHRGQSKPIRAHSISPSGVRPNLLALPARTKSSKETQSGAQLLLAPSALFVVLGRGALELATMTTWGLNPVLSASPLRSACSFGVCGCTFALYLFRVQYIPRACQRNKTALGVSISSGMGVTKKRKSQCKGRGGTA